MGQAKSDAEIAGEKVTFDFNGPALKVPRGARNVLTLGWESGIAYVWAANEIASDEDAIAALGEKDTAALRETLLRRAKDAEAPDDINYPARAAKFIIAEAAGSVFPKGKTAKRDDKFAFADWQEAIDFEAPETFETTVGNVRWLRTVLGKALDGQAVATEKKDVDADSDLNINRSAWLVRTYQHVDRFYDAQVAAIKRRDATPALVALPDARKDGE